MKKKTTRRYTREQLAAIVGMPETIPVTTYAAITGIDLRAVRNAVANGTLPGSRIGGLQHVATRALLQETAPGVSTHPRMLMNGRLVPRPMFDRGRLEAWLPVSPMTPEDVAGLTGQTTAEVRVDISAGRLLALRGRKAGVAPYQFTSLQQTERKR